MTFEEAIDKIILHQEEEERNPGAYVSYDGLGAMVDILRELEATYASKIKMTKAQFEWFSEQFTNNTELESIMLSRWETPTIAEDGYNDEVREIRLLDDLTLALAWLHPELIEVSND